MLHDVTIVFHTPGRASATEVVQVDATNGDDAVSQAMVEAEHLSMGRAWRIVGVAPSAEPHPVMAAPAARVEAEDDQDA